MKLPPIVPNWPGDLDGPALVDKCDIQNSLFYPRHI